MLWALRWAEIKIIRWVAPVRLGTGYCLDACRPYNRRIAAEQDAAREGVAVAAEPDDDKMAKGDKMDDDVNVLVRSRS